MKKLFKRLITLALAMMMLIAAPSTSALAASNSKAVLVYKDDAYTYIEYKFEPSPYTLAPGEYVYLNETSNAPWKAYMGKSMLMQGQLTEVGNYMIEVIELQTGKLCFCTLTESIFIHFYVDPVYNLYNDNKYIVRMTNIGSNNINIIDYKVMFW